jgi:hypothetical protein
MLEAPVMAAAPRNGWLSAIAGGLIPDPRELAVFAFIAKTLARSRQHRLLLTAFAAIAVAVIFESFASLALSRNFRGFSVQTAALRQAAISAPLALSLFVLAGFRYLFRLPLELRANWVFRLNEPGNRMAFLAAVERFLLCCAVAPVALITLPVEVSFLGVRAGAAAAIFCLLLSLALMELLLVQFDKIPFTSSYLPGRRPVIETVMIYLVSLGLYVFALSGIVNWCLQSFASALALLGILLTLWLTLRKGRLENWAAGQIEFEELPEVAVLRLAIERD